jgi:hypothetical protein
MAYLVMVSYTDTNVLPVQPPPSPSPARQDVPSIPLLLTIHPLDLPLLLNTWYTGIFKHNTTIITTHQGLQNTTKIIPQLPIISQCMAVCSEMYVESIGLDIYIFMYTVGYICTPWCEDLSGFRGIL